MAAPHLFAHRGAKAYAPENTLAAFSLAVEMGVPWIELDVHLMDGALIVIHDERVDRTTNGLGWIWDYSLEKLRALDAGNGEKIPLLEEVLEVVDRRAGLNVELKGLGTAEATAKVLQAAVKSGWSTDQFIVSSFFHRELRRFGEIAPEFPRAALTMAVPESYAEFAERLGCGAVHASIEFIDPAFIADAHQRGLEFRVYTVNHPEELARMDQLGVNAVFTDDPRLAD
jgi:glycerophosphoryl diester phosphodiesterase